MNSFLEEGDRMINETLNVIKMRRSTRDFSEEQLKKEEVEAIVESGLYAPNGGGEAWHFTVIQNKEMLENLNELAKEFATSSGLPWLESLGRDPLFHCTYHAPTVILVSGDSKSVCSVSDTAAATQNMLLAAESLNIGSCWGYFATQAFRGENGVKLLKEFEIPDGYEVYTSVMLGYRIAEKSEAAPRKNNLVTYMK